MNNKSSEENGIEIKKVICWPSPGCSQKCGLIARVKDGKIISLRGNPEFPANGESVPGKVSSSGAMVKPSRSAAIPSKRKGERGENKWERISWDQALDEIAAKLKSSRTNTAPKHYPLSKALIGPIFMASGDVF